jgi:hypothetical protein
VPADRLALRADTERAAAMRDVWLALWSSRMLVWLAGIAAILAFGFGPVRHAFDPPGVTRGYGWLGDLLVAPAARWDSAWYLVIAHHGYRPEFGTLTASRTAFFPLYPLGLSGVAHFGVPPVLAGVLLSLAALAVGLYGLHRLTTLEFGRLAPLCVAELDSGCAANAVGHTAGAALRSGRQGLSRPQEVGRLVVLLTALSPMAFYFSAIYSESLYLALSIGVFLCARRGRWGVAATLAGLAGAARSTGVVLVLPLVLLYLYGPREDRPPDRPLSSGAARARRVAHALLPRYRLRRDALWVGIVPVGLALYVAHLALAGGDPLSPFHAQAVWGRRFAGPYGGVWDGAKAAFAGARQLLSFQRRHVYFPAAGGSPFIDAGHNLMLFAFALVALPALVGVLRRLPFAYGVYVLAALALPLSYPVPSQPLMSLPRFLVVLFPLNMWFAGWLAARARIGARALVLAASAAALGFFAAQFATWHWVA